MLYHKGIRADGGGRLWRSRGKRFQHRFSVSFLALHPKITAHVCFVFFFSLFPPSCVAQDPIVRDVAAKLRQLSPDALVINLGNLAEELMLFAVGVDNVGAAFVHCF